jgi:hypothetical protein
MLCRGLQETLDQRSAQYARESDAMASAVYNIGRQMQQRLLERVGGGLPSSHAAGLVRPGFVVLV